MIKSDLGNVVNEKYRENVFECLPGSFYDVCIDKKGDKKDDTEFNVDINCFIMSCYVFGLSPKQCAKRIVTRYPLRILVAKLTVILENTNDRILRFMERRGLIKSDVCSPKNSIN